MWKIFTKDPIDRLASRVTQKGISYVPNKKISQKHFTERPPIAAVPKDLPDLTGAVFGQFKVIGLFDVHRKPNGERKSKWLVRCSCGDFEIRTRRAIKNKNNADDCCDICRHKIYIKMRKVK